MCVCARNKSEQHSDGKGVLQAALGKLTSRNAGELHVPVYLSSLYDLYQKKTTVAMFHVMGHGRHAVHLYAFVFVK